MVELYLRRSVKLKAWLVNNQTALTRCTSTTLANYLPLFIGSWTTGGQLFFNQRELTGDRMSSRIGLLLDVKINGSATVKKPYHSTRVIYVVETLKANK
jgi:hypothetical protein